MSSLRERLMQGRTQTQGTVTTTNGTVTDLNPKGGVLALGNSKAIAVTVDVVGRRTDSGSEVAGYKLFGVVKRGANAGTTALVGTPSKDAKEDSAIAATWDANLIADTTAGGVKVQVTGEAAKTIKWTATFRYTEA